MTAWGRDISNLAGTVAVTAGSVDVVGTSTAFLANVVPGNVLEISGVSYVVASVQSDTALRLTVPYAGATDSGLTAKRSQKPSTDSTLNLSQVFGADATEVRVNNLSAPGWVVRRTIGAGRTVFETLVAMKEPPVEDNTDDTVLPETTTTTTAAPTTTTTTAAPTTTTTTTP